MRRIYYQEIFIRLTHRAAKCADALNINEARYEDWLTSAARGLSMRVRPRQSRSPPFAPCNNLRGFIRESFHSGEPCQLVRGIPSRRWIMILYVTETHAAFTFAFLARPRFCR